MGERRWETSRRRVSGLSSPLSPLRSPVCLTVLRLRIRAVRRLDAVVDDDGGAWAELEGAGGDDFVARFHAADDRDLIAAGAAQLHELLADAEERFALVVL